MTQIVHLALFDGYADWEVGYLTAQLQHGSHLTEPGRVAVRTVGLTSQPVRSMGGLTVLPDLILDELEPAGSAALVLPGGDDWAEGDGLVPFVRAAAAALAAGTPVAAICGATFGLARAGLLDDRPHTSNDPHYLASSGYAGADRYRTEPVVVDGDLVTASGVAPVEFARAVMQRLDVAPPAALASWFKLYRHQDPAGFFELAGAGAGA